LHPVWQTPVARFSVLIAKGPIRTTQASPGHPPKTMNMQSWHATLANPLNWKMMESGSQFVMEERSQERAGVAVSFVGKIVVTETVDWQTKAPTR
jgi:hypothetical protein